MKKNIQKKLRKIDNMKNFAVKRFLHTIGYGALAKMIISVIGFLIGTYFYSKEGIYHLRIDAFTSKLGNGVFTISVLISMIFVIRLFKLKNQRDILKSIQ